MIKVLRGESLVSFDRRVRSAFRTSIHTNYDGSDVGIRLVLSDRPEHKVMRGGIVISHCRVASRIAYEPESYDSISGFRLAARKG